MDRREPHGPSGMLNQLNLQNRNARPFSVYIFFQIYRLRPALSNQLDDLGAKTIAVPCLRLGDPALGAAVAGVAAAAPLADTPSTKPPCPNVKETAMNSTG